MGRLLSWLEVYQNQKTNQNMVKYFPAICKLLYFAYTAVSQFFVIFHQFRRS